jgi:hypothetical protein
MFGVDAFIVDVAIPTIAVELQANSAQIEAVIAICLIAYATLVVRRRWPSSSPRDTARRGRGIAARWC